MKSLFAVSYTHLDVYKRQHNKINQRPNAETANSQQIKHAGAHLTHIETMDTEAAKEKAEKEGDPAVVGLRVEVRFTRN